MPYDAHPNQSSLLPRENSLIGKISLKLAAATSTYCGRLATDCCSILGWCNTSSWEKTTMFLHFSFLRKSWVPAWETSRIKYECNAGIIFRIFAFSGSHSLHRCCRFSTVVLLHYGITLGKKESSHMVAYWLDNNNVNIGSLIIEEYDDDMKTYRVSWEQRSTKMYYWN